MICALTYLSLNPTQIEDIPRTECCGSKYPLILAELLELDHVKGQNRLTKLL